MYRPVAALLIVTVLSMSLAPVSQAQDFAEPQPGEQKKEEAAAPPPPENLDGSSWVHCHAKGKTDAQLRSTGGSFVGGLAGGVFLGLIGTGIAVLAQSKSDPPSELLMPMAEEDEACRYTYLESYRNESVSKKRKSALAGGLIGTAIIVTVILVSQE